MIKYINRIKQSMGLSAKESFNQNKENPPKPDFIYYITFTRNGLSSHCFLSGLLECVNADLGHDIISSCCRLLSKKPDGI
jgi:hypothetical protein